MEMAKKTTRSKPEVVPKDQNTSDSCLHCEINEVVRESIEEQENVDIRARTSADGGELSVSAKDVEAQVKALRSSITDEASVPFDLQASYRLYQSIFGAAADKIASKKRLSVVANGALTSIPLQLLVTKDPAGKKLKDVDWFVRSHAIRMCSWFSPYLQKFNSPLSDWFSPYLQKFNSPLSEVQLASI
jgi:hypothetical protein